MAGRQWSKPNITTCHVTSGVPHVSVLGPVLFTIYIISLSDAVHYEYHWFADEQ